MHMRDIPRFCVIVGANGTGKSTLFQVFGFLREAFNSDVQTALVKLGGSRGFEEVRSRNSDGNIEIEIKFRAKKTTRKNPLITYSLSIGYDRDKKRAFVDKETLRYRRGAKGNLWKFLDFARGKGEAVTNEELDTVKEEKNLRREKQTLKSDTILAIKGLGQFEKFKAAVALGNLIENWHLSDIHIDKARDEQLHGLAEHLSREGENLSLVIDYLHQNHRRALDEIIDKIKERVPGVQDVTAKTIETGQVLLKIKNDSFDEPFLVRYVSDGTIKMLAYLVLLYDPNPFPLLCVEEPENQLYPSLLEQLADEFRAYAERGEQVFVSTHSPDLLNAAELDEVFWLTKEKGYTQIKRAKDGKQLARYMRPEGKGKRKKAVDKMGWLWKEGFFEGADPR